MIERLRIARALRALILMLCLISFAAYAAPTFARLVVTFSNLAGVLAEALK